MGTEQKNLIDETSRAIGRLEAQGKATADDVIELKEKFDSMDGKLDKLMARSQTTRLTLKHWALLFGAGSVGGGGIAHLLKKLID